MRRALALLALAAIALTACGSGGTTPAAESGTPTVATAESPSATASPAGSMTMSAPPSTAPAPSASSVAPGSAAGQADPSVTSGGGGADMTSMPPAPATASAPPAAPPAPTGTEIVVGDSDFGPMLFDASGQAIYLFDKETSPTPACYDDCAAAWPPVVTDGGPVAGAGVDIELLGTTVRTDGTVQVTYGGHPLYYYAAEDPFEVTCHDVEEYGGVWLVVTPAGQAAPA